METVAFQNLSRKPVDKTHLIKTRHRSHYGGPYLTNTRKRNFIPAGLSSAVDLTTCTVKDLAVNEYLAPRTRLRTRHHTKDMKNTQMTNLDHLSTV